MKDKVQKEYPDFAKEVDALEPKELETRIVGIQKALEESESHKADNSDLKSAREELNLLSSPYRDFKKAARLKTSYLLELLKERSTKS